MMGPNMVKRDDMEPPNGHRPGMIVVGRTVVNKGDLKAPEKVDRKLNVLESPRLLGGFVEHNLVRDQVLAEHNLVKELLDETGDLARRPPRAWRPLDPKMERALSTMLMKKRLHNEC